MKPKYSTSNTMTVVLTTANLLSNSAKNPVRNMHVKEALPASIKLFLHFNPGSFENLTAMLVQDIPELSNTKEVHRPEDPQLPGNPLDIQVAEASIFDCYEKSLVAKEPRMHLEEMASFHKTHHYSAHS